MSTTQELYSSGRLTEALQAQNEVVKKRPSDFDARGLLCELLCIAGNLERADQQLETLSAQAVDRAPGIALLRQLIRAEQWRRQFWAEGRVPEVVANPGERMKLLFEASLRMRENNAAEAARLLASAEEARPELAGSCDGKNFDDLRDLDDRVGGVFEILSSTGKYFWIAGEQLESIDFDAPVRPLDLLWRPAEISVRGGPSGKVYMPAVYAPFVQGAFVGGDDAFRLARRTEWSGGDDTPVRGHGQRALLVGDEERPLLEITHIEVTPNEIKPS
jgi:type VI secretion system protein ImpE